MMEQGRILQSIGGFYRVESAGTVYLCRACGLFRQKKQTPLVGDLALFEPQPDGTGTVWELLPRRNELRRPPLANVDVQLIVSSVRDPAPDALLLDKMIALAEQQDIEPVMVFTKADLEDTAPWEEIYRKAGLPVFSVTVQDPETARPLRACLQGRICAFTGNTGVGKSSLLNLIDPAWQRDTGEISRKLGRGRHTTRSAELLPFAGGYLADTPGFSSLEMDMQMRPEALEGCFREFAGREQHCRFRGCTHTKEPGCAVRQAAEQGEIAPSRYQSYLALYEYLRRQKPWEKR
ncbi:MAG: ribosome small subunit-dependent GTPase A [Clostridia bacterium]|nr:ribosome small subunit-dependent GTPase A [Clostridia bacterium]